MTISVLFADTLRAHPDKAYVVGLGAAPQWSPSCTECKGTGFVEADGCTCRSPSDEFPHKPMCGLEPCPQGCWDQLYLGEVAS